MFAFHRCLNANHGVFLRKHGILLLFCCCRRQKSASVQSFCVPGIPNSFLSSVSFLVPIGIMNFRRCVSVIQLVLAHRVSSFFRPNLTSIYMAPLEVAMVAMSVSFPHSATIKVKTLFFLSFVFLWVCYLFQCC